MAAAAESAPTPITPMPIDITVALQRYPGQSCSGCSRADERHDVERDEVTYGTRQVDPLECPGINV